MSEATLLVQSQTEDTLFYPSSDGRPMAESDLHRDLMVQLINLLQRWLTGITAYVSGNLLVYYEQGNLRTSVAPNCFVVFDIDPKKRRVYKTWEEGKVPDVVFEISSKSTQREDQGKKMRTYAQLGVQEYYIHDPTGAYLDPPLVAYELAGGGYVPMEPLNEEATIGELILLPDEQDPPEYESKLLGVRLALDEDMQLVLFDAKSGERLLTDKEARIQAEQQAKSAEIQASEAESRATQAEAENAELRKEIERLKAAN